MKRVMVIGNAGGGKSRLARRLSDRLELPLTEIDRIRWRPGWERIPEEEFTTIHQQVISKHKWVIDGWGSPQSVEDRMDACDTIILVDLPFRNHLLWALKRQITSFLTHGRDDPEGCPRWPHSFRLLRLMWGINWGDMPRLRDQITARASNCRVIHLKTRAALNVFTRNPS